MQPRRGLMSNVVIRYDARLQPEAVCGNIVLHYLEPFLYFAMAERKLDSLTRCMSLGRYNEDKS